MNLFKKVFVILFSLLTVATFYRYRTIPSGRLWNSYTVLYTPADADDSVVLDELKKCGIEEVISLSKQRVPVMFRLNSVEHSMYTLKLNASDEEYLRRRENFFFDSTRLYRLYYIPNEYKDSLNELIKSLDKCGIKGGIDSSFSYMWFLPLITLLFILILSLFSKKRMLLLVCSLFPLLYVLCNPFYVCTIASVLFVFSVFLVMNLWGREGAFKKIIGCPEVYIAFILSILLAFSNSVFSGLFFLMLIVSVFGIIYITKMNEDQIVKKQTYTFIMIRNARQTSIYAGKCRQVLISITIAVGCVLAAYGLNSSEAFSEHFARILLPGQSSIFSKDLTNLEDFCQWNWDIKTAPYKSINVENNSDTVIYPEYVKQDGKIKKVNRVLNYNQSFKDSVIKGIDELDFYSIEQVLKSQGNEITYGYTASNSYNISILSIILMINTIILLLFIDFSAIIKKGGKK